MADRPRTTTAAVDPDVDFQVRAQRHELRRGAWPVLISIAAGGVVGSTARHALNLTFPHAGGGFPWATFTENVTGCALMGVLMVLIEHVWTGHRLLRPFLGVGVLGGYTTFSAYVLDINQAVAAGAPGIALVYLPATPLTALIAVWATANTTRWAIRQRRSRHRRSNRHVKGDER